MYSMLTQYEELRAARGKTLATRQHEITQSGAEMDLSMISGELLVSSKGPHNNDRNILSQVFPMTSMISTPSTIK